MTTDFILRTGGANGIHFIQKGIPFAKNELWQKDVILIDRQGKKIIPQTKILKKHSNGSIAWLSVAFLENIEGEEKEYYLSESRDLSLKEPLNIPRIQGENSSLYVYKNGRKYYAVRPFVQMETGRVYMDFQEPAIVESGNVFKTMRIDGCFGELPIKGSCFVTLYAEIERISYEMRFTVMDNLQMTAQGLEISSFKKTIESTHDSYCIRLLGDDYQLIASGRDNVFFKSEEMGNGEYREIGDGFVYAPIQYNKAFQWLDGIARTIHLDINTSVSALISEEKENADKNFYAIISSTYYQKKGLLEAVNTSPTVEYTLGLVKKYKNVVQGGFEAGHMPYSYDAYRNEWGPRNTRPGETEYNLWYAYMYSGSEELNRLLCDSIECWADTVIYRGKFKEINGVNRYKTGEFYNRIHACFSQPYYGDLSGLYMSYLMTGNEYFKEIFLLSANFLCSDIERNGTLLCNEWMNGKLKRELWATGARTRFMAQIRPLWFAYELTNDEKYKKAAEKYELWIEKAQTKDGFWYQVYDRNFNPACIDDLKIPWEGACPVKNYIMLYGSRALAEYQRMSGSQRIKNVLIKFGDYLLTEITPQGLIWSPVANEDLYPTGEDGTRGICPHTAVMAVASLLDVYELTKNSKYLKGLLALLRFYISTLGGVYEAKTLGNNRANYLRIAPRLASLFQKEYKTAADMGYFDMIGIFNNSARLTERYKDFNRNNKTISMAEYETPVGKVITIYYKSEYHLSTYRFNAKIIHYKLSDEQYLWYGGEVTVKPDGCYTDCILKGADCKSFIQLPIRVEAKEDVHAQVVSWNGEEAKIIMDKKYNIKCDKKIRVVFV